MLETKFNLTNPECDPLADQTEKYVGRYAVCSIGRIGKITGRAFCDFATPFSTGKWAWVGLKLDGSQWASTRPRLIDIVDEDPLVIYPLHREPARK